MMKRKFWMLLLACLLMFGMAWDAERGRAQESGFTLNLPMVTRGFQPGPGNLSGVVINASSRAQLPVPGVAVCLQGRCTTTDAAGKYRFEGLNNSVYSVSAAKDGFAGLSQLGLVEPRKENTLNFALSPLLKFGNILMRFVLTWNPQPSWPNPNPLLPSWENDLDAHLWLSAPNPPTHVHYVDDGDCTAFPYACLESDARMGFGPESMALSGIEISTYYYGVVNWNQYQPGVPPITETGATVQVYGLNGLIDNFVVPRYGNGNFWYIFRIISEDGETGVFERVNCITDLPPEGEVPVCP